MSIVHGQPSNVHGSIIPAIPHHYRPSLQTANTPDINLERDIIPVEAFGFENSELAAQRRTEEEKRSKGGSWQEVGQNQGIRALSTESNDTRFRINLATIMISALIFLVILAWFDLIQTAFYDWLAPEMSSDTVSPAIKLWYALAVSLIILILIYLIYYYFRDLL